MFWNQRGDVLVAHAHLQTGESGVGSPTALRSFAYDSGHRLTSITMRDLSTVTFGNFHPVHQLPQTMRMASAGSINSSYNDRGDLVSLTTVDGAYSETNTYVQDALGRPRRADIANGASVELDKDPNRGACSTSATLRGASKA
ncbi:MAG: hypothetical protein RMA76_32030 [Deltaproteobacteria bacterium]|jgi:hypothetical protein